MNNNDNQLNQSNQLNQTMENGGITMEQTAQAVNEQHINLDSADIEIIEDCEIEIQPKFMPTEKVSHIGIISECFVVRTPDRREYLKMVITMESENENERYYDTVSRLPLVSFSPINSLLKEVSFVKGYTARTPDLVGLNVSFRTKHKNGYCNIHTIKWLDN